MRMEDGARSLVTWCSPTLRQTGLKRGTVVSRMRESMYPGEEVGCLPSVQLMNHPTTLPQLTKAVEMTVVMKIK